MNVPNKDKPAAAEAVFSLNDFLPYQIRRTQVATAQTLSVVYEQEFGLASSEWRVMAIIAREGKITSREIVDLATIDKVAVSRAATRLEEKKLVVRRPNLNDGRSALLSLSTTGEEMFGAISTKVLKVQETLLMGLDEDEKSTLMALLKKIEMNANGSSM